MDLFKNVVPIRLKLVFPILGNYKGRLYIYIYIYICIYIYVYIWYWQKRFVFILNNYTTKSIQWLLEVRTISCLNKLPNSKLKKPLNPNKEHMALLPVCWDCKSLLPICYVIRGCVAKLIIVARFMQKKNNRKNNHTSDTTKFYSSNLNLLVASMRNFSKKIERLQKLCKITPTSKFQIQPKTQKAFLH